MAIFSAGDHERASTSTASCQFRCSGSLSQVPFVRQFWLLLRLWSLTTSCRWLLSWVDSVIDRCLMTTIRFITLMITLTTASNSTSSSSMRTQRRMKTARTTYSTYLLPAHRLQLFQNSNTLFLFLHHGEGAGSQSSSLHDTYQQHSFKSTLLAINSTMRYDPPSPSSPQLPPSSTTNPPPLSLHLAHAHLTRHTPLPASRSRSRSRPPPLAPLLPHRHPPQMGKRCRAWEDD